MICVSPPPPPPPIQLMQKVIESPELNLGKADLLRLSNLRLNSSGGPHAMLDGWERPFRRKQNYFSPQRNLNRTIPFRQRWSLRLHMTNKSFTYGWKHNYKNSGLPKQDWITKKKAVHPPFKNLSRYSEEWNRGCVVWLYRTGQARNVLILFYPVFIEERVQVFMIKLTYAIPSPTPPPP